ncbi:MAG: prepilin-type N-terminal cleavage/methylation domain-containing protein [Pseudomonadota bacterium]
MNQKHKAGFSLLEVMLALVVITIAGLGAYSLFDSGVKSNNITEAESQVVQIANVYTDLASSDLTSNSDDIPTLLKDSGRLSSKYFSTSSSVMYNAFGELTFSGATAYSFVLEVPLGSINDKSTVPDQFFKKVQDVYSCTPTGDKSECPAAVACTKASELRCLTLYFNMNY